jgi:branched-chain amino acid transport system ATP-binding protein
MEQKDADMKTPILSVTKVNKHFGGLAAVIDVSFDVQAGAVLGLMGPNGAGKSTLLNIVSGEYKPDSGTVHFQGRDITGLPPHKICHLGIARTFQIPQPFVNLTVLQNLQVAAEYGRNLGKAVAKREALKILDIVDLSEKKDMFTRDLTAITLKRLVLARALASEPALLLLDEVAAGLTEEEIPRMLEILQQMRAMGITILFVEQNVRRSLTEADRAYIMETGRIVLSGKVDDLREEEKVKKAYFGT